MEVGVNTGKPTRRWETYNREAADLDHVPEANHARRCQRSSSRSPVFFATRESIRGPISSASWNEKV